MRKIAVFGSAFNPPSLGHKSVIESLTHFDLVLLVPSIAHAWGKSLLEYSRRCQLVDAFINDLDLAKVERCDVEEQLVKPGASVTTYQLLEALQLLYPNDSLTFVIGPDNLLSFAKFANCSDILDKYQVLACPEKIKVRSTDIRRNLAENLSIQNCTTPGVAAILLQEQWYR